MPVCLSTGWPWLHQATVAATLTRLLCQTCPTTVAMTIMPPVKLAADGTSLKQAHTQATANGVSTVLISAFSVAETI
jgi:hypothetical protein